MSQSSQVEEGLEKAQPEEWGQLLSEPRLRVGEGDGFGVRNLQGLLQELDEW